MSATDVAGKVLVTLGAGAGNADYVQVNFDRPYAAPPMIVISAADGVTAPNITRFYAATTASYFRLSFVAPTPGQYALYYMVVGTQ